MCKILVFEIYFVYLLYLKQVYTMKHLNKCLWMAVLLFACTSSSKEENKTTNDSQTVTPAAKSIAPRSPKAGEYAIKAAKVMYEYTDRYTTGTETLYFDEFGDIAVLDIDKKNKFGTTKQTIIWKDKKSTILDHIKKTVVTSSFRSKDSEPPTIALISEENRKGVGYEKLDNEEVAGKSCMVYYHKKIDVKYWLWSNIEMKIVNNAMGKQIGLTRAAKSIEEIKEIPVSILKIPADYTKNGN